MTTALLGVVLAAAVAAAWALLERARRFQEGEDLRAKLDQAEALAESWKGKALGLGEELRRVADESIRQGKRVVEVEQAYLAEIDALQKDLAECKDPKVVGDRLRARLERGSLP